MGEIIFKEIKMTLDPESIQHAIDDVRNLNTDLQMALDALCESLLKDGVMIARLNLRSYFTKGDGANKGNLLRSIRYEMANGKSGEGYLMAGYPNDHMSDNPLYSNVSYAVFFEFGFGTSNHYRQDGSRINSSKAYNVLKSQGLVARSEGRTSDHPSKKGKYRPSKDYKMIENNNGGQFRGWVYKDRWTGKFYTVRGGQPPKPFMYNTLLDLMDKAQRNGANIIAEYLPGGGAY